MAFLKRNYGWILLTILACLPLIPLLNMLHIDFSDGISISLLESTGNNGRTTAEMMYHVSGEFAIRWMTAVITLTPWFIIFGVTNLFVRQAMSIATAVWSLLHFIIFIWVEGFLETFTQVNLYSWFYSSINHYSFVFNFKQKIYEAIKNKLEKTAKLFICRYFS